MSSGWLYRLSGDRGTRGPPVEDGAGIVGHRVAGTRVDGQSSELPGSLVHEVIGSRLCFVHGAGGDDELAGTGGLLTRHCSAQQVGEIPVAGRGADHGKCVDALG